MSEGVTGGAFRERLSRAADLARDRLTRADAARWELYAKASTTHSVTVADGRTTESTEVEETGVGVRTWQQGRAGFGAASGLESDGARRAVESALRCAAPAAHDPLPPARLLATAAVPVRRSPPPRGWAAHAVAELRRTVAAASGGAVTLRRAVVDSGAVGWLLATAEGFVAGHEETTTAISAELALADGARGAWREWLHVPAVDAFDPEAAAHRLVDRILLTRAPVHTGGGIRDLLLHPEVAAHLLAGLAPLLLAAPGGHDPLPRLLDAEGYLAAPALTVYDSRLPEDEGPVGGPCDGEGLAARRTLLIDEGVPRHRLACYADAVACGEPPRGGAVRLSFRDPPESGLSSLAVATAGGLPPGRLLAACDSALYLLRLAAPPTCDLARDRYRLVASGLWLERGRPAGWHPVVELEGQLGTLLRRIDAVGTDRSWHQTAAGFVGTPSILVRAQPVRRW